MQIKTAGPDTVGGAPSVFLSGRIGDQFSLAKVGFGVSISN